MADWVENLHPRAPKGSPTGGRFIEKGDAGAGGWSLDDKDWVGVYQYQHYATGGDAYKAINDGSLSDGLTLTPRDDETIRRYAISSYPMNRMLRLGATPEALGDEVISLDDMMKRSNLSEDIVVYRGFNKDIEGAIPGMQGIKPGDRLLDSAFMSTTAVSFSSRSVWDDNLDAEFKILAPKGSRAIIVRDSFPSGETEIIFDRGSRLEYVGEANGQKVFRLKQDQVLTSKAKVSAPKEFEPEPGIAERRLLGSRDLLDVTDYPGEGAVGFLTVGGRMLTDTVGKEHRTLALDAGTNLNDIMEEGNARVYADQPHLGIEILQRPSDKQIKTLQKMARANVYESFLLDSGRGGERFEDPNGGPVTSKMIADAVESTWPQLGIGVPSEEAETYYHGTLKKNLTGIRRKGLNSERLRNERSVSGGVYLTSNLWSAINWAQNAAKYGGEPVVVEVKIPKGELGALSEDRTASQWNKYMDTFRFEGDIPRSWIAGYHKTELDEEYKRVLGGFVQWGKSKTAAQGVEEVTSLIDRSPKGQEIMKAATETAEERGYDPSKIVVINRKEVRRSGNRQFNITATTDAKTGEIRLLSPMITDVKLVPGFVAHEVEHQKYWQLMKDWVEARKLYPDGEMVKKYDKVFVEARERLHETGRDISNYATSWWDAAEMGAYLPEADIARNETLAEIARIEKETGSLPPNLSKEWKAAYDFVNENWDRHYGRRKAA